jgi:tetratricopeptide (TPR) repeat protein
MARKKRRFEQLQDAAATPKEKKKYVDPVQQKVVPHIESLGGKLEGKGRTILYGAGAVIVLIGVVLVIMNWSRSSSGKAQTALGKAIETSQAQISETGPMAGSTAKTYKTEKERAETAIAEFQTVVDNYGGDAAEKARYFIAVNRLALDRPAGIAELEGISNSSSEAGTLAKFALAQTRADDGRLDEAAALYLALAAMQDPVVAKDTINFELARVYEKQGKKQEAVDLYFAIAKAASEAKDLDGNPVRMTETAIKAREKVEELDPERAKEIPDTQPQSPFGGAPFGM